MKYTIEQKARLKGMDCLIDLRYNLLKTYRVPFNRLKVKDDFVIVESKMNYKKL
jgi:hypothetical protein